MLISITNINNIIIDVFLQTKITDCFYIVDNTTSTMK